ncbi:MAG: hypothetical protein EBS56_00455 [Planctomycetia bacterium]|nr:hypothetical protein [Planctomycetia bacterium]
MATAMAESCGRQHSQSSGSSLPESTATSSGTSRPASRQAWITALPCELFQVSTPTGFGSFCSQSMSAAGISATSGRSPRARTWQEHPFSPSSFANASRCSRTYDIFCSPT